MHSSLKRVLAILRPKRRWFQYSLRSLLLLTLVVSLGLSWFAVKMKQARRQQAAVAALSEPDVYVRYDWMRRPPVGTQPDLPWYYKVVGIDMVDDVVEVYIMTPSTDSKGVGTDAMMTHLNAFPHLEVLSLQWQHTITDTGFAHVKALTELKTLEIRDCPQLTDSALAAIEDLDHLETVHIFADQITDTGLGHLRGLENLKELVLDTDGITDAGLANLSQLSQLKNVAICSNSVSDEGIEKLQKALPKCKIGRWDPDGESGM